MPKIQKIPEEIRGKIAAGEVIDRPASILKELIENALDAKAQKIKIEIIKGGLEKIVVYDDGEGMSPEDLKLAYLPFTTSKIRKLSDIYNLYTYGFRGEALNSIAQVSRLRILSKERGEDLAFEILIEFGKEKHFKPGKIKEGTLVEVRDLFENLPARKAFLKNPRTETLKNMEILKALMLTHPEVRFQIWIDEKETLNWQGGTLPELFSTLFEIPQEYLISSEYEEAPYKINLLLTDTRKTFAHSRFLYFLVNLRIIKYEKLFRIFFSLLKKYFGSLGFPAGVVHLLAPPQLVDFNVHPAKWEIRFKEENRIYNFLESVLKKHFNQKSSYFYREPLPCETFTIKEDLPLDFKKLEEKNLSPKCLPWEIKKEEEILFKREDFDFKILGVFQKTYILVEKKEDLYLIDQHALAERIHYENLKKKTFTPLTQKLILPLLLHLTPEMEENLEEKRTQLLQLGFEIDLIKENLLIVKGAPYEFLEDLKEILENFLINCFSDLSEAKDYLIKAWACKLAWKKGDHLPEEEKRFLIQEMFKHKYATCPHGRPLFIRLTLSEIEKQLKRKL